MVAALEATPDDSPQALHAKQQAWDMLEASDQVAHAKLIANAWCAAFVIEKTPEAPVLTQGVLELLERNPAGGDPKLHAAIRDLADRYRFFHPHLVFPQVVRSPGASEEPESPKEGWSGGFDVVLGNPPWERVKIQEKEWFGARQSDIAKSPNAATRKKRIKALATEDPPLHEEWLAALRGADAESQVIRSSGRYPLCGRGDVNTFAIFAELMRNLTAAHGRMGAVVPSGIATDDTTKFFFQDLVESRSLASLLDFENKGIFPAVHNSYKFCLLVLTGPGRPVREADFVFFAHSIGDLADPERRFTLASDDFALLNPKTRTCPVFRSRRDAELTKTIYRRAAVADSGGWDSWSSNLTTQFHSANDASKFEEYAALRAAGWQMNNSGWLQLVAESAYRLYEGKMFSLFDHRASSVVLSTTATVRQRQSQVTTLEEHRDPGFIVTPFFAVKEGYVAAANPWKWVFAFKKVTSPTNERTLIASLLPPSATNDSIHLVRPREVNPKYMLSLLAFVTTFLCDYVSRQKLGGVNFNFFVFEQLPHLDRAEYLRPGTWDARRSICDWIAPRVLELVFTAWDLKPLALDLEYEGSPFLWDPERRALVRAELDAAFFHLYDIDRDNVDYIMETFPIVRKNDEQAHGEYRTKRLTLEIFDAMAKAIDAGQPYRTILDPPPADSGSLV